MNKKLVSLLFIIISFGLLFPESSKTIYRRYPQLVIDLIRGKIHFNNHFEKDGYRFVHKKEVVEIIDYLRNNNILKFSLDRSIIDDGATTQRIIEGAIPALVQNSALVSFKFRNSPINSNCNLIRELEYVDVINCN